MAKFTQLILTELGNTTESYNYSLHNVLEDKLEWRFKTPDNTYLVEVIDRGEWLMIGFTAIDNDVVTNEGRQFEIVATVMDIAKETWNRRQEFFDTEKRGFQYHPIRKSDEPFQKDKTARDKLYRTFINSRFPDAKVQKVGSNIEVVLNGKI